jgi:hypothetical protein
MHAAGIAGAADREGLDSVNQTRPLEEMPVPISTAPTSGFTPGVPVCETGTLNSTTSDTR